MNTNFAEKVGEIASAIPSRLDTLKSSSPFDVIRNLYSVHNVSPLDILATHEASTVKIEISDIKEAAALLSLPPQPTQYSARPKSIYWNGDKRVQASENELFNDYDLTVKSYPEDKEAEIYFKAQARDSFMDSTLSRSRLRLLKKQLRNNLIVVNGIDAETIFHFPDGKGFGFHIELSENQLLTVEVSSDYNDETDEDFTMLTVKINTKPNNETEDDHEFETRIHDTIRVAQDVIPNILNLFTKNLTTTQPKEVKLKMPMSELRNQQEGVIKVDNVEPPSTLYDRDEIELFKQIARNSIEETLDIVGGLDVQKKRIGDILASLKNHKLFIERGLPIENCVLFYGPPGTGKTLLAQVASKELGGHLLKVDCGDILNKWLGESESRIKQVFKLAKRLSADGPVTLFFDEFDVLGRAKGPNTPEWMRGITNTILTSINELPNNCLAIAACNNKNDLEPAIRREGRFSEIEIPLPDEKGRAAILTNWIDFYNKMPAGISISEDISIEKIIQQTHGMSGSELKHILVFAITKKVLESIDANSKPVPCTTQDLLQAIIEKKQLKGDNVARFTGQYL